MNEKYTRLGLHLPTVATDQPAVADPDVSQAMSRSARPACIPFDEMLVQGGLLSGRLLPGFMGWFLSMPPRAVHTLHDVAVQRQ
jgi:hypothetical protein